MKERTFAACLGAVLSLGLAAPGARAGQVVTKEDRAWAKKAVAEEKSLGAAAAPNTVAVLYFRNPTGQPSLDPLRKGLALMLITDLSSVGGVQVVERVRLQALVEELGLGTSGLVDEGSAPRVGRLLGSRWLVGGDLLAPDASRAKVDSATLDVPKGVPVGQTSAEGGVAEFFQIEKDLLFGVLGTLKVELTPEQEARLRRPCTRSTKALLALSLAVEASDAGRYEEAASYYEKALKEDPGVCLAGDGLKELRALRLLPEEALGRSLLRSLHDETSLTNQLTPKDQLRDQLQRPGSRTETPIDVTFP